MTPQIPSATRWVIVGGGFAGAATAWALARMNAGPGVILEQEDTIGVHASGRNAGLLKIGEDDPLILSLVLETVQHVRALEKTEPEVFRRSGGLTIAATPHAGALAEIHNHLVQRGLDPRLLTAARARDEHPLLHGAVFDAALWIGCEGVIDVHALLTSYLRTARAGDIPLQTRCKVHGLLLERGHVAGVETSHGPIRADVVIDAAGAWAGRLRSDWPHLPLTPMRRHLFVTPEVPGVTPRQPFVWFEGAGLYFRPEANGLLLSPCDESPHEPGLPVTDPAAADLLAEKLAAWAPPLADLPIRKSWACLRTFAPDRRPVIGFDPEVRGLFHVSGLGGFGVMSSAGVGRLAAALLAGRPHGWIDATLVSPARAALRDASRL